jgi:hypothetical protein
MMIQRAWFNLQSGNRVKFFDFQSPVVALAGTLLLISVLETRGGAAKADTARARQIMTVAPTLPEAALFPRTNQHPQTG